MAINTGIKVQKRFCRLLELPNEMQFLLLRSVNNAGKHTLSFFTPPPAKLWGQFPGCMLSRSEFDTEEQRDSVYDSYTVAQALAFMENLNSSVEVKSNNIIT